MNSDWSQPKRRLKKYVLKHKVRPMPIKSLGASLTDKILQDKGIEATLELARSPNAKVVVVGSGDDGLPLILGNN